VFPRASDVRLVFEHGARLFDPEGVLEGTTKQTRHVTLASLDQLAVKRPALSALVMESIGLGNDRVPRRRTQRQRAKDAPSRGE
jgi:hypothetical protein